MEKAASAEMTIREARPSEYRKVALLTVEAYREYAARMTPEAWAEYESDLAAVEPRAQEAIIVVAERGGELAGALTYFPAGRREWLPADWAYFRALAVAPDHRGHGVGPALTLDSVARARAEGAAALALHTTEVMTVAKTMYERLGFTQHSEHRGTNWTYWLYVMPLG